VISAATEVAGTLTEGSVLTDSGSFTFSDVDLIDRPSASVDTSAVTVAVTKSDGNKLLVLTPEQLAAVNNLNAGFQLLPVDTTNTNTGTVNWTFSASEDDLDFLAAGDTVTLTYSVSVSDDKGGSISQPVTITITGTNDAPQIESSSDSINSGSITEASTTDDHKNASSVEGHAFFRDVDLSDQHHVELIAANLPENNDPVTSSPILLTAGNLTVLVQYLDEVDTPIVLSHQKVIALEALINQATFVFPVTENSGGIGSFAWKYTVADNYLDFISEGERLTLTYRVALTDDSRAENDSVAQDISITITGTNDGPDIQVGESDLATVTISEDKDKDKDEVLSASGTLTLIDFDLSDRHNEVDVSPIYASLDNDIIDSTGYAVLSQYKSSPSHLGLALGETSKDFQNAVKSAIREVSFSAKLSADTDDNTIDPTGVNGTIAWELLSSAKAFNFLSEGEELTLTYQIEVTEKGHGKPLSDTQNVTVTIKGTNDTPTIEVPNGSNTIFSFHEDANKFKNKSIAASGILEVVDADISDTVSATHSVTAKIISDTTTSLSLPNNEALKAMFSIAPTSAIEANEGSGPAKNLSWTFKSESLTAFDFLAEGETLELTYTIAVTDDSKAANATAYQDITIQIIGSNDIPKVHHVKGGSSGQGNNDKTSQELTATEAPTLLANEPTDITTFTLQDLALVEDISLASLETLVSADSFGSYKRQ